MQEISYLAGERTAIASSNTLIILDSSPDAELATTLWRLVTSGFTFAQLRDILATYSPIRLPDLGIAGLAGDEVSLLVRGSVQATVSTSEADVAVTADDTQTWTERRVSQARQLRLWIDAGSGPALPLIAGMVRAGAIEAALARNTEPPTPPVAVVVQAATPPTPTSTPRVVDDAFISPSPSAPQPAYQARPSAGYPDVFVDSAPRLEGTPHLERTTTPPDPVPYVAPLPEVFVERVRPVDPTPTVTEVDARPLRPAGLPATPSGPAPDSLGGADLWVTPSTPHAPAPAAPARSDDGLWVAAPVAGPGGYVNAHDNHTEMAPAFVQPSPAPRIEQAPAMATRRPSVRAVRCPQAHLNPQSATSCRACGSPIVDHETVIVPRPSLGVLNFGNQVLISLDESLIIGREPGDLGPDGPRTVPINHPSLSRRHLEVRLHDWMVVVIDLNSQNGTTVQLPGRAPQPLSGNDPVPIPPGTVVRLANEVPFTYEVRP